MSVPGSNSMNTSPAPSRAIETTRLTESRWRTSRSAALTMLFSTSAELAPGHDTATLTKSMPMVGKNWVLRRLRANRPAMIIPAISRFEALRWRTKRPMMPPEPMVNGPRP